MKSMIILKGKEFFIQTLIVGLRENVFFYELDDYLDELFPVGNPHPEMSFWSSEQGKAAENAFSTAWDGARQLVVEGEDTNMVATSLFYAINNITLFYMNKFTTMNTIYRK